MSYTDTCDPIICLGLCLQRYKYDQSLRVTDIYILTNFITLCCFVLKKEEKKKKKKMNKTPYHSPIPIRVTESRLHSQEVLVAWKCFCLCWFEGAIAWASVYMQNLYTHQIRQQFSLNTPAFHAHPQQTLYNKDKGCIYTEQWEMDTYYTASKTYSIHTIRFIFVAKHSLQVASRRLVVRWVKCWPACVGMMAIWRVWALQSWLLFFHDTLHQERSKDSHSLSPRHSKNTLGLTSFPS